MNEHKKRFCLTEDERKQLMAEINPILEKKSLEEIKLALQLINIKNMKQT
ncbi:hypothetical protein ACFQU5_03660 [Ureibacillus sp. GCM10028918]